MAGALISRNPPKGDDLVALVALVLENASVDGNSKELGQCAALWQMVGCVMVCFGCACQG